MQDEQKRCPLHILDIIIARYVGGWMLVVGEYSALSYTVHIKPSYAREIKKALFSKRGHYSV